MGYFTVTIVFATSAWVVISVFKHLRSHHFSTKWWLVFTLLVLVGIAVGAWAGTQWQYQPNMKTRVLGFPVPLAVFVLEGENWIDFVPPAFIQYGAVAANVLAAIACVLVPLTVAARMTERHNGRNPVQGM